jgi:hypothetical protein
MRCGCFGDGNSDFFGSGDDQGLAQFNHDDLRIQSEVNLVESYFLIQSWASNIEEIKLKTSVRLADTGSHSKGILTSFPDTQIDQRIVIVVFD